MLTAVDKIVEFFPQTVVTSIVVMLTYNSLVNQIYHVFYNKASVYMTLHVGKLGCLALTISLMVYTTLSATTVVKIPNSGPTPIIPTNTTGIQKATIKYKFNLETELYMIHQNIDKDLKQQILGVI